MASAKYKIRASGGGVMSDAEKEFLQVLNHVGREARACVVHAYSNLAFNHIVGSNTALLDRINQHADYWNSVAGAEQAASFIALGRLYDSRRGTWGVSKVLKLTGRFPGIFRREELARRK